MGYARQNMMSVWIKKLSAQMLVVTFFTVIQANKREANSSGGWTSLDETVTITIVSGHGVTMGPNTRDRNASLAFAGHHDYLNMLHGEVLAITPKKEKYFKAIKLETKNCRFIKIKWYNAKGRRVFNDKIYPNKSEDDWVSDEKTFKSSGIKTKILMLKFFQRYTRPAMLVRNICLKMYEPPHQLIEEIPPTSVYILQMKAKQNFEEKYEDIEKGLGRRYGYKKNKPRHEKKFDEKYDEIKPKQKKNGYGRDGDNINKPRRKKNLDE